MFTRLKETGQHTLIFGMGGMLQQAIGFVLLPVYTRYLTPADYGVLNLLLVAGSFVAMVPSATVGPSLFRSYYDYETEADRSLVVSTALFLSVAIAGVLLLIGALFARPLSMLLTGYPQYAFLTVIVLLNSALSSINIVALAVFRAQKWSSKYLAVSTGSLLVSLGTTIYLVVFQAQNIAGVVWGLLAGGGVAAFLSLWMIRHHLRWNLSPGEMRKMVSYGLPFIPENLIGFGINSADRLVIQALLGPAAVGLYALGRRFGQIVQILVIQPFSLVEPATVFSAERDSRAKEFYARLLTYYLFVTSFTSLGVSLLAPDVLKLMAEPIYWPAGAVVPWMCLALVLYGMRGLVSVGLSLKRQTQWFPIALGLGAVAYLTLMVLLIPGWDIVGAAIALTAGYVVVCLVRYLPGQRIYPLRFEWARIIKIVGTSLFVLVLGEAINIESPWISIILKSMVVILGMPILLFLLRFLDTTEMRYLRSTAVHLW